MPPSSGHAKARPQKTGTSSSAGAVRNQKIPIASQPVTQDSAHVLALHVLPIELQQTILNVFTQISSSISQDQNELKRLIQLVKGHLYAREFLAAFSQQSYLQAYAVRWSAARALGYANLLTHPSRSYLWREHEQHRQHDPVTPHDTPTCRIVCIGGGAGAELVALAAAYRHTPTHRSITVTAIDIADWSDVVTSLTTALSQPSSAARPETQPLLTATDKVSFTVNFVHQDILSLSAAAVRSTFATTHLVTLFFTLNELFSTSIPRTTAFLLALTAALPSTAHLLVLDSPGSYSEIALDSSSSNNTNKKEAGSKQYPMKWLLDHTLLTIAGHGPEAKWVKLEAQDSVWFRLDRDKPLDYPVELENMRYQIHVYRRL